MNQTKRGMVPSWVAPFLQSLRDGIGVDAASDAVGIGSSTAYRRRDSDPGFRAAWDAIRKVGARATPTGRNSGRDKRRIERFLAELAATSNVAAAAALAEMSVGNMYRLRRTDPAFALRWYAALAEGYDNLEMELLQHLRGHDGDGGKGGETGKGGEEGETPAEAPKRKLDVATALRCLTAHRESVAREKGRRALAVEVATIAGINAKIDAMRARARESDAAIRKARKGTAHRGTAQQVTGQQVTGQRMTPDA